MRDGSGGWPSDARHCLRIGAMNDKRIVEESQASFDVLVLQANLAISAPRGLSSWIQLGKPFWIDPIAYAFVAEPIHLMSRQKVSRGSEETVFDFKRTFRALADAYGEPFSRVIAEKRSLAPGDFDDVDGEDLLRRVIEWQRTVLASADEDTKYLVTEAREPVLLTVPFFPLRRRAGNGAPAWLDVNVSLAQQAAELYEPSRLAVGLLIETGLFDSPSDSVDEILQAYEDLPIEHVWLWLSDNEEVQMTLPRAERLLALVERLSTAGKRVHQAFGGSFSAFLLSRGLTSVGHGVAYWEHKNWEPLAGGGVPTLRYFYPPLRRRLPFLDADQVIDSTEVGSTADFHGHVCGCRVCVETLDGDLAMFARFGQVEVRTRTDRWGNSIEYDVPSPESLYLNKRHYLEAKGREVAEVLAEDFDVAALLNEAIERNRQQEIDDLRHLEDWRIALTGD